MLLRVYSLFDSKVGAYQSPIFRRSKLEAIRDFADKVNDPSNPLSRYSEDFTLFELGVFDDEHATFELHNTPISVGVLIEFRKVD